MGVVYRHTQQKPASQAGRPQWGLSQEYITDTARSQSHFDLSDLLDDDSDLAPDSHFSVSFFGSLTKASPTVRQVSLNDLADIIGSGAWHDKTVTPMLKVAVMDGGASTKNVKSFTGCNGDFDGKHTTVTIDEAAQRLRSAGVAALLYTSANSRNDERWRVLCPFSKSVSYSRFCEYMNRMNGALDGIMDDASSVRAHQRFHYGQVEIRSDKTPADPQRIIVVEGQPIDTINDIQPIPYPEDERQRSDPANLKAELYIKPETQDTAADEEKQYVVSVLSKLAREKLVPLKAGEGRQDTLRLILAQTAGGYGVQAATSRDNAYELLYGFWQQMDGVTERHDSEFRSNFNSGWNTGLKKPFELPIIPEPAIVITFDDADTDLSELLSDSDWNIKPFQWGNEANEIDLSHDALAPDLGASGWNRDARYCAEMGGWLLWNGTRWQRTEGLQHMTMIRDYPYLVAEHHWDEVGWAMAENAWRFEPMMTEGF